VGSRKNAEKMFGRIPPISIGLMTNDFCKAKK
jgi:hypothetical protein